ncbi:unnamed protein product [Didymodactylos carnosus]|uniref:Stabilizer of axonemal microtubules 2 n=2 Tax=Didymodactylos carnosus TaxID=1234261 RepID=A0A813PA18_9BILA|nr:unnamed protein product [Didymodactylos carnosus]CAF3528997.1 unnamed protein product [Didymodactylos carnosus]
MTKLCVCQICTCGHHRCPHRPFGIIGKGDQPCAVTEYRSEFIPRETGMRQSFKPDYSIQSSNVPMDDETTHKHDYIRHALDRQKSFKPDEVYVPMGDFDSLTSYNKEYTGRIKGGERARPIRHDGQKLISAPFEGDPTYRSDYRKWEAGRTEPIRHDAGWTAPVDPFRGESTYTTDFLKHNSGVRQPIRPDQGVLQSVEPFDDRTGYRTDYIKHPMQERFQRTREEYIPNKVALDSLTTHRKDFTPKEGDRTRSMKPDQQGYRSDARFDDSTTNKTDFKKWDVQPNQQRKPDEYRAQPGDMDLNTMYNTEYTHKPMQKVNAIRPTERRMIDAKFQADTTYGGDYRKWPGSRPPAIRSQSGYEPPMVPFEGLSTYKGHYIPHQGGPSRSFKPDGSVYASGAPFDDSTMYRVEFTPKSIDPCPAALLETPRSSFVFRHDDPTGHKFYQPHHEIGQNGNGMHMNQPQPIAV